MATKTETLRKGLIALGYSRIEHASRRECYSRMRFYADGKERMHYVFLLTGTLRGGPDSRIGQAISLPGLTAKALLAGK